MTLDSQSAWAPAKSLPSQSQEPHEGQLDESSGASVVGVEPALLVIQMLLFVRCPRLTHQVIISFYLSEDLLIRAFCHNFMIHTAHPHPLSFKIRSNMILSPIPPHLASAVSANKPIGPSCLVRLVQPIADRSHNLQPGWTQGVKNQRF